MKYRKKPVVVEAIPFSVGNPIRFKKVREFVGEALKFKGEKFYIQTLVGNMQVAEGDYIIKGVAGDFIPCKKEIFEETYEEVENE